MRATPTETETPTICPACGADEMGCQVKSGLSGRRCCDHCQHDRDHDQHDDQHDDRHRDRNHDQQVDQ